MSGSSPKAPDYTPLAVASEKAAQLGYDMGKLQLDFASKQLDFSKQQYDETKPLIQQVVDSQLASQNETQAQGRDYYDYLKNTYRPLEQQMVSDTQNFDTDAYREQLAQKAASDAGLAFQNTRASNERAMMSMGVNPNSGKFASLANQSALDLAANRASAMNQTRTAAEATGYARNLDAIGLGKGLTGASTGAYGVALSAGNSAAGNAQIAGNNYQQGMNNSAGTMGQGIGTMQNGLNTQMNGLNSILDSQTSIYGVDAQSSDGIGKLAGTLGSAAILAKYSDRRLKQDIVLIGAYPNGLNKYEFSYRADPSRRFVGVMADEVKLVFPEAVPVDKNGFMAVDYGMLGIAMREVVPCH